MECVQARFSGGLGVLPHDEQKRPRNPGSPRAKWSKRGRGRE